MLWTCAKQTQGERRKRIQRGEEKEKRGEERGFAPYTVKNIRDVKGVGEKAKDEVGRAGQQEEGEGVGFGDFCGNTRCQTQ